MAAIATFSITTLCPLGAIWRTMVKRTTLLNETFVQRVRHASYKKAKGRLA